mmetsp:Transcript_74400/g.218131  ORF Transcript_74400/g.218131 Transcript_74400/m.218131 type:complete len:206 (+) Transcript_74400:373-990(+)
MVSWSRCSSCIERATMSWSSASRQRRSVSSLSASRRRTSRCSASCLAFSSSSSDARVSRLRSALLFTIIALKTRKSSTLASCSTSCRWTWFSPVRPSWQKARNSSVVTESSTRCAARSSSTSWVKALCTRVYSSLFSSASSNMMQFSSMKFEMGLTQVGALSMAMTWLEIRAIAPSSAIARGLPRPRAQVGLGWAWEALSEEGRP